MSISRRKFLKISAIGAIGFAGSYSYLQKPAIAYASDWFDAIYWFSDYMYSSLIANSIYDYMDYLAYNLSYYDLIEQINYANYWLAQQNYSNLGYSSVYDNSFSGVHCFYYPVVYDYCGCLYHISPFFNFDCSCEPVTYIHSPHLAGLALAAQELSQMGATPNDVNDVLLPVMGRNIADGNPVEGYNRPLEYESRTSNVRVNYRPVNRNTGRVQVRAVQNTPRGGRLLVNNEYTLNVSNA